MSTETIEVVPEQLNELLVVAQQNSLPHEAAKALQASFAPSFNEAHRVLSQSRAIVVTDGTQKLQIKLARECRLALKEIRVGADKLRKELKDESLRRGRAIDGFYNILLHLTETEENRLAEQERFVERQEAARIAALVASRSEILRAFGVAPELYQLGVMTEDTFNTVVDGIKLQRAAAAEAARKAEEERIAREASERIERERIRLENERLKKEAAEREEALRVERARIAEEQRKAAEAARVEREAIEAKRREAEAQAKKEREAREKIESEARAKRESEVKAQKEREARIAEEQRKAALAPDKEKLIVLASALRTFPLPTMITPDGKAALNNFTSSFLPLVANLDAQANRM